jgi:hypothetical protein
MSYSSDVSDGFRCAGIYVEKILWHQARRPTIKQASKFAINLKTAKAFGRCWGRSAHQPRPDPQRPYLFWSCNTFELAVGSQ